MIKKIPLTYKKPVINGVAEYLPFKDNIFQTVLLVTTICFVDDSKKTIFEANRILKKNGQLIIAFVDKDSELGKIYQKNKEKSKFYNEAVFYSTVEILELLRNQNFQNIDIIQTVFGNYKEIKTVQKFKYNFGEGNFVVIKAEK